MSEKNNNQKVVDKNYGINSQDSDHYFKGLNENDTPD